MRFNTADIIAMCMTTCLGLHVWSLPVAANDPQDAHRLAERFAGAHDPKPKPNQAQPELQAEQVEGAFKVRKQEAELRSTDEILDSIEARTKAIEDLLEKSALGSWDATTTTSDEEQQLVQPDAMSDHDSGVPIVSENAPVTPQDVYELPQPSYALGGAQSLRTGLAEASELLTSATILLKIKPGNKGLRRFKKTADPVVCGRRHCYMSAGFDKAALRLERGATLGPFNTLGRRAGACRQKLVCAFRNVDVSNDGVLLQPVDLKFMRHDRRAYRSIKADPTCAITAGRLHCDNPVVAKTWTAWVVPEHVALEAGEDGLTTALQDGLPDQPVPTIHVRKTP